MNGDFEPPFPLFFSFPLFCDFPNSLEQKNRTCFYQSFLGNFGRVKGKVDHSGKSLKVIGDRAENERDREKSKPRTRAVGAARWSRNPEELRGWGNHLRICSDAVGAPSTI